MMKNAIPPEESAAAKSVRHAADSSVRSWLQAMRGCLDQRGRKKGSRTRATTKKMPKVNRAFSLMPRIFRPAIPQTIANCDDAAS